MFWTLNTKQLISFRTQWMIWNTSSSNFVLCRKLVVEGNLTQKERHYFDWAATKIQLNFCEFKWFRGWQLLQKLLLWTTNLPKKLPLHLNFQVDSKLSNMYLRNFFVDFSVKYCILRKSRHQILRWRFNSTNYDFMLHLACTTDIKSFIAWKHCYFLLQVINTH